MVIEANPTRVVGTSLELSDGESAHLILNFGLMRALSRRHKDAYAATMRVLSASERPDLDSIWSVLWMAYLCGCEYDHIEPMDEEDFYINAGGDYFAAMSTFSELIDPNHRAPTARRS